MRALCAVLTATVAAPAHAGVDVGVGVPFSADELERALAARSPAAGGLSLRVQALSPGRVWIVSDRSTWEVDLGDARGTTAATLVALNVLPAVVEAEVRSPRRAGPRVAAYGGVSTGLEPGDLTATVAGVELRGGGRWWLGAAAEWHADLREEPADGRAVDGRSWLVRGLVGRELGPFELWAGPLAGWRAVDSGAHASGWQLGVGAGLRARWSVAPGWSVVPAIGADGYRHRIEVRQLGEPVAATPRVAVAATVGLSWEPGR